MVSALSAKQIMAAWRVLVGVWVPREWDLSSTALSQYTQPPTPPPNPWIDKPRTPNNTSDAEGKAGEKTESKHQEVMAQNLAPRRPPSRRLVRHVLRSRVEAMNALASFFDELARAGSEKRVKASLHLAERFGGGSTSVNLSDEGETIERWRYGVEVIRFLEKRGGKVGREAVGDEWVVS